ncbi:MAG: sulfatase [Verrucomicrobiota bacterium]
MPELLHGRYESPNPFDQRLGSLHSLRLLCLLLPLALLGKSKSPNFVVVLADDHAFEAISCYGTYLKNHAKTPNIDRLAKEGMRFDEFVCANSICSPSRATILTGQYSHLNGVTGLNGSINEDSPQYPEQLLEAGYETFLVGKWHLKSPPKGYLKHMTVKGQGKYFDPTFNGSEGTINKKGYSSDVYTDLALDWLKNRNRDKPFLLSLQFKAPHHDYGHAQRYDKLLEGVSVPEPPTLYEEVRESDSKLKNLFLRRTKFHMLYSGAESKQNGKYDANYYTRHLEDPAPNEMGKLRKPTDRERIRVAYQHMIRKYVRCATGNDDNLKRVLDFLDRENLKEDTVVIYTSDQGYWLGQHGFYDKRLILETSIRMPFVIRYPRLIKAGSVSDDLCVNVDLAPTILELAGINPPDAMQGKSMVPILRGKKPKKWRESQFYTYWGAPNHYGIRTSRFTYLKVFGDGVGTELYDRKIDPHQKTNFAQDPSYASELRLLEKQLSSQIKRVRISADMLPGGGKNP